jgi:hypothetical protein
MLIPVGHSRQSRNRLLGPALQTAIEVDFDECDMLPQTDAFLSADLTVANAGEVAHDE